MEQDPMDDEMWLLEEIVERIPEMIFVKDAHHHTFVKINQAAEELLGISRQEMLGKTDFDFFPHHEAVFFQEKDRQVLESGRMLDIPQEQIQTRLGTRSLHTQKIPILDERGEPRFLLGISRDITDFVRAQQELERSQKQLRVLANQLQQAQEEERKRLARELHDELGQVLTGVKIELAWMEERLPPNPPQLSAHLEQAVSLVDSAMATVRRVASALRPQILDDLGLGPAVDWLLHEICGRARIHTRLDFHVSGPIPAPLSITIYRACQEALTNIVRHAKAQNATVRIETLQMDQQEWLLTEICDDGSGFASPPEGSLGLVGIRERVQLHGGAIEVTAGPDGSGTTLKFRLPR